MRRDKGQRQADDAGLGAKSAKWLASYPKVSAWMSQYDLRQLLASNGGLLRIDNFLPLHVADDALAMLEAYSSSDWTMTAATEDVTANNIPHEFWSTKNGRGMSALTRALTMLLPGCLHSFSAAKYCSGHHIAPHDDRAYSQVLMDDGQVITCCRDIAVIYYLTKDWKEEYGGHLVDLEGNTTFIPTFNSLVAFTVPRYHEVTAVLTQRPRYSIFGWFLEPGMKYELYTGEERRQQQQQRLHDGNKTSTVVDAQTQLSQEPGGQERRTRGPRAILKARRGKRAALLQAQAMIVFGHAGNSQLTRHRLLRKKAKAASGQCSGQ